MDVTQDSDDLFGVAAARGDKRGDDVEGAPVAAGELEPGAYRLREVELVGFHEGGDLGGYASTFIRVDEGAEIAALEVGHVSCERAAGGLIRLKRGFQFSFVDLEKDGAKALEDGDVLTVPEK